MNTSVFPILTLCVTLGMTACATQQSMPGGVRTVPVSKKEVVDAAAFAIQAEAKALQGVKKAPRVKLELVKVLRAEEQVVAGMKYRLKLRVKLNGKEKIAEATVWWQAWRKPDPYRLTAWVWK